MIRWNKVFCFLLFLLVNTVFCSGQVVKLIPPQREFRGAWIATIADIDWPSKAGLPSSQMLKEITNLLDKLQAEGLNAVIVQVRPTGDAIYPSRTEPWSHWLTGKEGVAPDQGFDPLAAFIGEAHKRHMEFHAWFNPFRLTSSAGQKLSVYNIGRKHPEWTIHYDNKLFLNPGIPDVQHYLSSVIAEVVTNYDVDAIHFDDYFYPYKVAGKEFQDVASFKKYGKGIENRDAWRRANIDAFIQETSLTIKKIKPWVKFGISPFGVWRNKDRDSRGSATHAGTTCYDDLYADVIKWQQQGLIDYLLPQLYWEEGHRTADFVTLCDWWAKNNYGRAMYIGHALYRLAPDTNGPWGKAREITNQVRMVRNTPGLEGSVFYSAKHFTRNLMGFQDSLQKRIYKDPAIPPAMPWIDNTKPVAPINLKVEKIKKGYHFEWQQGPAVLPNHEATGFIVYKNRGRGKVREAKWITLTGNRDYFISRKFKFFRKKYEIRVTALDRMHNESDPCPPITIRL